MGNQFSKQSTPDPARVKFLIGGYAKVQELSFTSSKSKISKTYKNDSQLKNTSDVNALAITSDSATAIFGDMQGHLSRIDLTTKTITKTYLPISRGRITKLLITSNNKTLFMCDTEGSLKSFSINTTGGLTPIKNFGRPLLNIYSMRISKDNNFLFIAGKQA
jgi:hypothetical protein